MKGGVQGPEHPNPGQQFSASNFPRQAFLPDTEQGETALHGVYLAWAQRLMFTVGRSITTGQDNCVTWNDIHMKTNVSNRSESSQRVLILEFISSQKEGHMDTPTQLTLKTCWRTSTASGSRRPPSQSIGGTTRT